MTHLTDDIKHLREALAKGPTRGEWVTEGGLDHYVFNSDAQGHPDTMVAEMRGFGGGRTEKEMGSNGWYIASCHPDRIERLLNAIEELSEALTEISRLKYGIAANDIAHAALAKLEFLWPRR